jgi:hypothetical protein
MFAALSVAEPFQRLARQRLGLLDFVRRNQSKYALFRYWPYTAQAKNHDAVEVLPSKLLPGSMGLFATSTIVGKPLSPIRLADYVGVLMWSELQEAFDEEYHCPTTAGAEVLNYHVDGDTAQAMGLDPDTSFDEEKQVWTVHVFVVGDPTSPAAITNSARHISRGANAQISQCVPDAVGDFLSTRPDGKIAVRAAFLRLWTDGNKPIKVTSEPAEILVAYDCSERRRKKKKEVYQRRPAEATFWDCKEKSELERPYCDRCFRRDPKSLVVCTEMHNLRDRCSIARHTVCFDHPPDNRWYCPKHAGARSSVRSTLTASCADSTMEDVDDEEDEVNVDMEDDQQTICTAASTQIDSAFGGHVRQQSLAGNKRIRSFSLPKAAPRVLVASTDNGRRAVIESLKVWNTRIASVASVESPDIVNVSNEEEVKRFVDALDQSLAGIKSCCASTERIKEFASANSPVTGAILTVFDSSMSLLDARYGWREPSKFRRKDWQCRYFEAISNRQQDSSLKYRSVWCGVPLCDGCFALAVGVSASTVRRIDSRGPTQGSDSSRSTSLRCAAAAPSSKMRQVIEALKAWAQDNGSSLPTADGMASGKHYVLQTRTVAATLQQVRDAMRLKFLDPDLKISRSTFGRAILDLKKLHGISLNIRVWKKLAKCDICTKAELTVKAARNSANLSLIQRAETIRSNHNAEWKEQRDWFDDRKRNALRHPSEEVVFTLDGMDQSKTSLPHFHRGTNATKNGEFLNVRIVGAFAFGGCIPCMGFITLDNVKGKGANASATIMERMIDLQFEAQDPTKWEPLESLDGEALAFDMDSVARYRAKVVSAASESVDEEEGPTPMEIDEDQQETKEPEQLVPDFEICRRPVRSESSLSGISTTLSVDTALWNGDGSSVKPTFVWPRSAHFTFDNTTSDTKNSTCFRFFGELVALGVYHTITVSCLMVGHTHDIVDQMFSVWSRQLSITDAPTIEKMVKLFSEKYNSNIYAVKEIMTKVSVGAPDLSKVRSTDQQLEELMSVLEPQMDELMQDQLNIRVQPLDEPDVSIADDFAEQKDPDVNEPHTKESIHRRLKQVAQQLGVRPRLEQVKTIANIDRWFDGDGTIQHLSRAHVFLIQREQLEDLVESVDPTTKQKVRKKRDYESIVMYTRSFARSYQDETVFHEPAYANKLLGPYSSCYILRERADTNRDDPIKMPPVPVKTDGLRLQFNLHEQASGVLVKEDKASLDAIVDGFDKEVTELANSCVVCLGFANDLAGIGPIRQGETAAEKERASKQTAQKVKIEKQRAAHMDDPLFSRQHLVFTMHDWWKKWIDRVERYIRPYYIARGILSLPSAEQRHISGRHMHPAKLPSNIPGSKELVHKRVDLAWLHEHGAPVVGDVIAIRSKQSSYPVYFGRVIEVQPELSAAYPSTRTRKRSTAKPPSKNKRPGKPSKATPPILLTAAAASSRVRSSTRRAAAAKAGNLAEATSSESSEDESFEPEDSEHSESVESEESDTVTSESSGDSELDEDAAGVDAAASTGLGAAASGPTAKRPKIEASTRMTEPVHILNAQGRKALGLINSIAGGAAGSASSSLSTEGLVKVSWLQFLDCPYMKAMNPNEEAIWMKFAEECQCVDEWKKSVAFRQSSGGFYPVPQPMFEKWNSNKVCFLSAKANWKDSEVALAECIMWSPTLLTKTGRIPVATWRRLAEDTCEITDSAAGNRFDYEAEASMDFRTPKGRVRQKAGGKPRQQVSTAAAPAASSGAAAASSGRS